MESFKSRLKEQLPDEGQKLDLAGHFRTLGEFESQLSKSRGDRRAKSVPNKVCFKTFDILRKEILERACHAEEKS